MWAWPYGPRSHFGKVEAYVIDWKWDTLYHRFLAYVIIAVMLHNSQWIGLFLLWACYF